VGEAVGIIAAQSIGEPGTQLTLRTFHIGGTASRVVERSEIRAKEDGVLEYQKGIRTVENRNGDILCISRNASLFLKKGGQIIDEIRLNYGAKIKPNAKRVKKGDILTEWDPHTIPIITEHKGIVRFLDIKEGETLHEERNKVTGIIERKIIEHKGARRNPRIVIEHGGKKVGEYPLPLDTIIMVEPKESVERGDIIAKIHKEISKTKDITGGLPRVAELFEVRKPKNAAIISKIEGVVSLGTSSKGLTEISIKNEETGQVETYIVPYGKHLLVYEGDRVDAGEALTDGAVDMHDLLAVKGLKEVQNYIVGAIQEVYRLQGVSIHDKYIEIIVRQMLGNVKITEPGNTVFMKGEIVPNNLFIEENQRVKGSPAQAEPILLGISKASLASESFISAASFQETTRVLTDAATTNKVDYLKGLKENVIIGHLIPAGSGFAGRVFNNENKKEEE